MRSPARRSPTDSAALGEPEGGEQLTMRVAAVIFDMDGLMIDTEGPVQACCQEAALGMGFDLDDEFYVADSLDVDGKIARRPSPVALGLSPP